MRTASEASACAWRSFCSQVSEQLYGPALADGVLFTLSAALSGELSSAAGSGACSACASPSSDVVVSGDTIPFSSASSEVSCVSSCASGATDGTCSISFASALPASGMGCGAESCSPSDAWRSVAYKRVIASRNAQSISHEPFKLPVRTMRTSGGATSATATSGHSSKSLPRIFRGSKVAFRPAWPRPSRPKAPRSSAHMYPTCAPRMAACSSPQTAR